MTIEIDRTGQSRQYADPYEGLRDQMNLLQQAALGVPDRLQQRADIEFDRERDESRRQEDIDREQARFDTQQGTLLQQQERQTILTQLDQVRKDLADMDADDPLREDALWLHQYLLGMLNRAPGEVFGAMAEDDGGDGRSPSRILGQLGGAATAGREAAAERAAERAKEREFEKMVLGHDLDMETQADQQRFQQLMQGIIHQFERGQFNLSLSAEDVRFFARLGFDQDQASILNALQQKWQDGQLDLENRRLDLTQSRELSNDYITLFEKFDPNRAEDLAAMKRLVERARTLGMEPAHLASVELAYEAQFSRGAQQQFTAQELANEHVQGQINSMGATEALTRAQTHGVEWLNTRNELEAGRADVTALGELLQTTAAMGDLGLPILHAIRAELEEGREDSQFASYFEFLGTEGGRDILDAAIDKATEIASDEQTQNAIWRQSARNAMIEGTDAALTMVAGMMRPDELAQLLAITDENDPMFTNGIDGLAKQAIWRMLKDDPIAQERVQRESHALRIAQDEPYISAIQNRLTFYGSNRPPQDGLQQAEDSVRADLMRLVDYGLFGIYDPTGEFDDYNIQQVENMVNFYRQAWGDSEQAFNAELAEIVSRTAVNNANAAKLQRDAATMGTGGGSSLEGLSTLMTYTDKVIDGIEAEARLHGCYAAEDALDINPGVSPVCANYAAQIAEVRRNYTYFLNGSGVSNVSQAEEKATRERIFLEVADEFPDETPEFWNTETNRRYGELLQTLSGGPRPEGEPAPAAPSPTAAETSRTVTMQNTIRAWNSGRGAMPADSNLREWTVLAEIFGYPVGASGVAGLIPQIKEDLVAAATAGGLTLTEPSGGR